MIVLLDSVSCQFVLSYSVVCDSATPWMVAQQAPLSMRILQARILEWVAMPFSRGSSPPRDQTRVSSISCFGSFTTSATQFPQLFFPPTSLHSLFKAQGDWITDYICLLKEWSAWKNVFLPLKIFLLLSSRYFQKELESIWVQPSMLSIYSGHSAVVLFRYLNK